MGLATSEQFSLKDVFGVFCPVFGGFECVVIRSILQDIHSPTIGSGDVLLSQKLAEELKYEKEAAVEPEPEFLTTFKQQDLWKVKHVFSLSPYMVFRHS